MSAAANPASGDIATAALIAQMALNRLGVNPFPTSVQAEGADIITPADIASGALRMCGANIQTAASLPGSVDVTSTALLAPRLLVRLGVYASDETASATDLAVAINALLQVQAALVALAYVTWADGAIPDQAAELYLTMATYLAGPSFGKTIPVAEYEGATQLVRQFALSGANVANWAAQMVQIVHEAQMAINSVFWGLGAIPYAVGSSYMMLAADAMAPLFGRPRTPPDVQMAQAQIRAVALSGVYGQTLAAAEVQTLHDELTSLNVAAWTVATIPRGAADAYAVMTANRLAPLYDKPRDPKAIDMAMQEVRAITLLLGAQPLAVQVLMELHAEWRQRGMTRWEMLDIPREAEEPYIAATGARLAAQFPNAQSPPNALMLAESGLYRIIALATSGNLVQADYF